MTKFSEDAVWRTIKNIQKVCSDDGGGEGMNEIEPLNEQ